MARKLAFDRPLRSIAELEHELRTPLTSILSISEILRDHPEMSPEERLRFLDAMVAEGDRLAALIELLLGNRELESALFRPAPAPEHHPA